MTVKTECVHCRTRYTLKDPALVGKKIRCKRCGKPFKVERIEDLDDFDEEIEDYGNDDEIEDYGDDEFESMGNWPPAQVPPVAGAAAKSKKKKKKKSGSSGAWKTPVFIVAGLAACGLGIWGLIQVLPANIGSVFDSHEAIIDDSIDIAYEIVDAMEDINSQADVPAFEKRIENLAAEADQIEERLLALGTISKERMKEIQDYAKEQGKKVEEDLRERSKAVQQKLSNANLKLDDRMQLLKVVMAMKIDWDLVLELPDPKQNDVYSHDLVELYRESYPVLLKVKHASNPATYLADLKALTAKFEELSRRGDRARPHVTSPYFGIRLKHSGYLMQVYVDLSNHEQMTEEVRNALTQFSSASSVADSPF